MKKLNLHGKYCILALDQRTSFAKMLGTKNKNKIISAKKEIIQTIGRKASAILLDPIYCRRLAKHTKKPVLFCTEKSGYRKTGKARKTELIKGFNAAKAKKLGASAIKLNLQYNPETNTNILRYQQGIVRRIGRDCRKNRILFLLEIIAYPIAAKFDRITETLQSVNEFKKKEYNVSIFKLEYPGSKEGCRKITKMLGRKPWVLLSAGKPMKTFAKELKTAMKTGCSGFLAGRAIWQDGLKIRNDSKRQEWFAKQGVKHINRLINIALKRG
jgi:tagatose 1,6-diphosphate aldolase